MKDFIYSTLLFIAFGLVTEAHAFDNEPPEIESVECSTHEDQCYILTITGEKFYLDPEVLPYFVFFDEYADETDCDFELCYDDKGSVTGLNPNHPFY